MEYVSKSLLLQVDQLREQLDRLDLGKLVRTFFEHDSNSHSEGLENPGTTGREIRAARRVKLKHKTTDLENLLNAWRWATTSFTGQVNRSYVESIVRLIEHDNLAVVHGYRTDNVRITGFEAIMPPQYVKVPSQMESLFALVNNQDLHPVERAVLTHFHISRIHPFIDGNGRSARLLQNLILSHEEYAPCIIRAEERSFYQELLRAALRGYENRTASGLTSDSVSNEEKLFFDYLSTKIIMTYKDAMSVLDKLPVYHIVLKRVKDPSLIYGVKRRLEDYFRAGNLGQARISPDDRNCIIVRGNITGDTIRGLVERSYDHKYTIERKK